MGTTTKMLVLMYKANGASWEEVGVVGPVFDGVGMPRVMEDFDKALHTKMGEQRKAVIHCQFALTKSFDAHWTAEELEWLSFTDMAKKLGGVEFAGALLTTAEAKIAVEYFKDLTGNTSTKVVESCIRFALINEDHALHTPLAIVFERATQKFPCHFGAASVEMRRNLAAEIALAIVMKELSI